MMDFFSKLLGLPVLAAETGKAVDDLIIYVHWLMIALFIGWAAYFVYAVWRFNAKRHPKADHHGVRSHISSYIEVVVAGVEIVLLAFVAVPLWAKASNITKVPQPTEATTIQVMAQQFNWNVRYPGKDNVFGKQNMSYIADANLFGVDPNDEAGKDDLQIAPSPEIHVPVNKPVVAYISSKDVIHSFKIIAMRVTQDAIPGMRIPTWFTPTKEGRYQINCAQLCGNSHSSMSSGFLIVESQEAFEKWKASKTGGATSFE